MTPQLSWGTVAKPLGRWVFKHLPTFIFTKYYNLRDLEDDIKIRLRSARLEIVEMARKLQVPYYEVQLEAFNMSGYLDVHVRAVRSFFLARTESGAAEPFACLDDLKDFDLPRGHSRPIRLTYWLNEFQMAVVSIHLKEGLSMEMYVGLVGETRIGAIRPFKILAINRAGVRQTGGQTE